MCIFQKLTFELHTSEPRIKAIYYLADETDKAHRKRQSDHQREERERNLADNVGIKQLRFSPVALVAEPPVEYIAESSEEEIYTPRYGDELVMLRGKNFKILNWKSSIIQGRYTDHWDLHAWSDSEDFIRECISDRRLVKVGNWGTSDLPEIVGYYREAK